jgi:type II secretory pathway pseudopilin PulG
MSLFDLILGQKRILLSLAVSAAPLLSAALILLVSRLKQRLTRRARTRRSRAVQQQRQEQQQQAAVEVTEENVVPPQPGGQPVQPGAAQPDQPPDEETPEEQPQAEPASAVQDILSSVFTDGDDTDQYGALLESIEDIDVSQLAAMCSQVGDQLGISRSPATQD